MDELQYIAIITTKEKKKKFWKNIEQINDDYNHYIICTNLSDILGIRVDDIIFDDIEFQSDNDKKFLSWDKKFISHILILIYYSKKLIPDKIKEKIDSKWKEIDDNYEHD